MKKKKTKIKTIDNNPRDEWKRRTNKDTNNDINLQIFTSAAERERTLKKINRLNWKNVIQRLLWCSGELIPLLCSWYFCWFGVLKHKKYQCYFFHLQFEARDSENILLCFFFLQIDHHTYYSSATVMKPRWEV